MANTIYSTINNNLLPQVFITSIIVENNNITVDGTIEFDTNIINNTSIKNFDYFKYLNVEIFASSDMLGPSSFFAIENINSFPFNFSKKIPCDTSVDQTIRIFTAFSTQFFSDYNITPSQRRLLEQTYFGPDRLNWFEYPLLNEEGQLIQDLIDTNGKQVSTIASDLRTVSFFEEDLQLSYQGTDSEKRQYIDLFESSYNSDVMKNYFNFDYQSFFLDHSYFKDDDYKGSTITLNIIENNRLLDIIVITHIADLQITLSSRNSISYLVSNQNGTALIYFTDQYDNSYGSVNKSYVIQATYLDNTYTKFYNPINNSGYYFNILNGYSQVKNIISIAQRFSTFNSANPDITPFYLNLNNNKFTNSFINFYDERITYFANFNIRVDLPYICNGLIQIINKFLPPEEKLNVVEEADKLVQALNLENSNINTYYTFFNSCDKIFSTIESILSSNNTFVFTYNKSFPITHELSNAYFSVYDKNIINNNLLKVLTVNDVKQILLVSDSTTNLVIPQYFNFFNDQYKIQDNLNYDTEFYSYLLEYIDAKNGNRDIIGEQEITSDNFFASYGTTFEVEAVSNTTNKPKNLLGINKKTTLFSDATTSYKKTFYQTKPKIKEIKSFNKDEKQSLNERNKLLTSLLVGETKEILTQEFLTPKITLMYYDNTANNNWIFINDTTQLKTNMFIKASVVDSSDTIFSKNRIPTEKINLYDNYFVIGS